MAFTLHAKEGIKQYLKSKNTFNSKKSFLYQYSNTFAALLLYLLKSVAQKWPSILNDFVVEIFSRHSGSSKASFPALHRRRRAGRPLGRENASSKLGKLRHLINTQSAVDLQSILMFQFYSGCLPHTEIEFKAPMNSPSKGSMDFTALPLSQIIPKLTLWCYLTGSTGGLDPSLPRH